MNNSRRRKVKQIVELYASGKRNFQDTDLRGLVLRGQDLSGANFSRSDVRGADFSSANLANACFKEVQAGLGISWQFGIRFVSLILGLLSGFLSTRIAVPVISPLWDDRVVGVASLAILVFFGFSVTRVGLLKGGVVTTGLMALFGTLAGAASVSFNRVTLGFTTLEAVDTAILSIAVIGTLCLFLAIPQAVGEGSMVAGLGAISGATSVPLLTSGPIAENLGISGTLLAVVIAIALVQFCHYLAKQALAGNPRQALIRRFAITVVATLGTRFRKANLACANFSNAQLQYSDFRANCLDYTRWDQATGLDRVRWGKHPMGQPAVQNLLITRSGYGNLHLAAANLAASDLSEINFQQANLKGAKLSSAKLCGADLTQSNLSLTQALGTDFTGAVLTGICIEGWSIDRNTCLDNVECAFVYRLEQAKPGGDDRERQPSSGKFEPGDFTQLFQVVLNTVEFIFRNGVDREALAIALKKIQASYDPGIQLQGVENKSDGFFKVTLDVPKGISKAELHKDFRKIYRDHVEQIESRYQARFQAAQQQIEHYQKTTTDLTAILKQLTCDRANSQNSPHQTCHLLSLENRAILTFWDGSLEQGYPITADIRVGTSLTPFKFHANLPPAPELSWNYQQWQSLYRQTFGTCSRIQFDHPSEMTNVSRQELAILANRLTLSFQDWMRSPSFRLIADKLREKFLPEQTIQVIIQTEDAWLRRLPWHLWKFLEDYPKADVALSGMSLETISPRQKTINKPRVLAILGNDTGINLKIDQRLWQELDQSKVEICFLREPNRQQFHEYLWAHKGWDILYFSGHSYSQPDGYSGIMQLNPHDQVSVEELQFALKKAVNQGLQLAILNSCDGLGLASALCTLKIPQVVAMKEPVPDSVAHSFLDYFLQAITSGASFHSAFRDARQQLSGLENQYPYASWLPTLFQTRSEVSFPRFKSENIHAFDDPQRQ